MATFTENSVRQVIVAKVTGDVDVIDVGTKAAATSNTKKFYIKYKNADGLVMKSDIIDKDSIRFYKAAPFAAEKQRTITIKVKKDNLAPNTEYSLRVMIREVMSGSQEDQMVGVVSVTTSSNTDKKALSKEVTDGFAAQLNKMYGKNALKYNKLDWPLLMAGGETAVESVGGTADTLVIKEVPSSEKPWIIGKVQLRTYNFDVYPNPVVTVSSTGNTNFETFDWLDTTSADAGFYSETVGGSLGHGNGKVAADLEYFYHGEIGDFYRMNNYPYNITTKYMVDPSKSYDTLDLAFFYRGEATSPQASEKQLLILCEKTDSAASLGPIATKLNNLIKAIVADPASQADLIKTITLTGTAKSSGNVPGVSSGKTVTINTTA